MAKKWHGFGLKLLVTFAAVAFGCLGMTAHPWQAVSNVCKPVSKTQKPQQATIAPKPRPKPLYTFPNSGRTLFPGYRLVALYGTPGAPVLGALGQQPLGATIARVKQLAKEYQPYSKQPILPTLEIIATIASASPTDNNDYSQEVPVASLQPWITAARESGAYVVLDLQPGRQNFLPQAKEYATLLEQPNVGLALDPEWHLQPGQVPLAQIGSADITDVNQTAAWLAALTKQYDLPQKLLLLHEFRLDMLPNRNRLNTTYPQLAYAIQMDGQGTQNVKLDTWHAILAQPPADTYFGWKNFYLKDSPMLSPAATMALSPQPWYISYQ